MKSGKAFVKPRLYFLSWALHLILNVCHSKSGHLLKSAPFCLPAPHNSVGLHGTRSAQGVKENARLCGKEIMHVISITAQRPSLPNRACASVVSQK
jgi:hypothetical protein